MKKNQIITKSNKVIIKDFWNDFASKYLLEIVIAFFLLILVAATASVYPYLIQLVFDGLLDNQNNSWIVLPLIIAVVAIIRGIAMFFQIKQVSKISLSISVDIQKKLSKHLINSDLATLNKFSSPDETLKSAIWLEALAKLPVAIIKFSFNMLSALTAPINGWSLYAILEC